jgi:hypothetical protein
VVNIEAALGDVLIKLSTNNRIHLMKDGLSGSEGGNDIENKREDCSTCINERRG